MQILRACAARLSDLLVLAVIGLAAYWGHHNHWKVPSLSDLTRPSSHPAPDEESELDVEAGEAGPAGRLKVVTFDSPEDVRHAGIETAPVVEKPLDLYVDANATVGYDQTRVAHLSSRVEGFVWCVEAQVGQAVREGDVLAVLDAQEVGQAKADLQQEIAACRFKERYHERLHHAARAGAVPEHTLREAEAEVCEARIRRANACQRLINMGFDIDLDALICGEPEDVGPQLQFLGIPPGLIGRNKLRPRTANLFPIKAPFDGVVTQLKIVVGERVDPDHPPVVLADVRRMWVKLAVRKEHADRLALGQHVQFTVDGVARSAAGRLTWISTEVDDKTRTVQARAEMDNPPLSPTGHKSGQRLLRANEYGAARVRVARVDRAVLVPEQAIQRLMDGTTVLFVARPDGQSFEPRQAQLAGTREGLTQVLSGAAAGERVATRNSYVLKSEMMKDTLVSD